MEGLRNYDYPQQAAPRSEYEDFEPPESKNCSIYGYPTIVRIDAQGEISREEGMFVLVPKNPNLMQVECFDGSSQVVWDEFEVEADYGYFCPIIYSYDRERYWKGKGKGKKNKTKLF